MEELTNLVAYLALISVAAERMTDILKRLIYKRFELNGVVYQITSFIFGSIISILNPKHVSFIPLDGFTLAVVIGLIASGGSSFWHEILNVITTFNTSAKDLNTETNKK